MLPALPDSDFVAGVLWERATEAERWCALLSDLMVRRKDGTRMLAEEAGRLLAAEGLTTEEYRRRSWDAKPKGYGFSPPSVLWFIEQKDGTFNVAWDRPA